MISDVRSTIKALHRHRKDILYEPGNLVNDIMQDKQINFEDLQEERYVRSCEANRSDRLDSFAESGNDENEDAT